MMSHEPYYYMYYCIICNSKILSITVFPCFYLSPLRYQDSNLIILLKLFGYSDRMCLIAMSNMQDTKDDKDI